MSKLICRRIEFWNLRRAPAMEPHLETCQRTFSCSLQFLHHPLSSPTPYLPIVIHDWPIVFVEYFEIRNCFPMVKYVFFFMSTFSKQAATISLLWQSRDSFYEHKARDRSQNFRPEVIKHLYRRFCAVVEDRVERRNRENRVFCRHWWTTLSVPASIYLIRISCLLSQLYSYSGRKMIFLLLCYFSEEPRYSDGRGKRVNTIAREFFTRTKKEEP